DGIGIFVVGYGDMVKNTLTALIEGGYEGCIVCTSTLTDKQWQPAEEIMNKEKVKIFTVLPQLRRPHDHLIGDNRNVVFLFARKTLLRVVKLSAGRTDSKAFLEDWMSGKEDGPDELKQDYLKCGDTLVRLRIVS